MTIYSILFNQKNSQNMERKNILKNKFLIIFHGKFIPLQGISYIVKAAKILEQHKEIQFQIIGKGQDWEKVTTLAAELNVTNIDFLGRVTYKDLPSYISKADLCLGIFGDTTKTLRVIPNKVYEYISMKKPVISGNTPAIKELFEDRKNILLCNVADEKDIADKILILKEDDNLRNKIANEGYELFKQNATPKIIGKNLLKDLHCFYGN